MPNFLPDTNRLGLIVWGGERSVDYGMVVDAAPTFEKPKRKTTIFNVPGRNGSVLFQQDAFEDVTRSYHIWVAEETTEESGGNISGTLEERVDAITAWLYSKKGYQKLEDNFEPDVYRLAYYSGGNNISNEMTQYGETTLTFTCRPERFLKAGEDPVTVSDGDTLNNPSRFASKPLIHIEGSGNISISVGGASITARDVVDYINIDCERMNAYREPSENMNEQIQGTFPSLLSGANVITITGATTLVTITPNYFTI